MPKHLHLQEHDELFWQVLDAGIRDSVKMFVAGARALGRMLASLSSTDGRLKRRIVRGTTIWKINLAVSEGEQ